MGGASASPVRNGGKRFLATTPPLAFSAGFVPSGGSPDGTGW